MTAWATNSRAQRLPLPSPRVAKWSGGEGSGAGGDHAYSAPHPGAFGAGPPHRFAGGGWSAPLPHLANETVLR